MLTSVGRKREEEFDVSESIGRQIAILYTLPRCRVHKIKCGCLNRRIQAVLYGYNAAILDFIHAYGNYSSVLLDGSHSIKDLAQRNPSVAVCTEAVLKVPRHFPCRPRRCQPIVLRTVIVA